MLEARRRVPRRHARSIRCSALLAEKLGRRLRRLGRAARPRPRDPRPQRGGGAHPHRHRLALVGLVRPRHADRQARHRARRRQHRDGLLPQLEAPRRQRRQGDRALALRGDEGVAVGEGRRDPRRHPDPRLPGAEGVPAQRRQAHRHELRQGARGARRQGPAPARLDRRARAGLRVRRRAGRGRPGERLPLDRARRRHRLRRMGHAGARRDDAAVEPAARLLRRRRGARPEEHHLGGRPGPRRGDLDRQVPARRGRQAAPRRPASPSSRRRWASTSGATTTTSRPSCATRCRGATSTSRCATSRSRSSSASTSATAWKEAQRCLNCDVQTVFTTSQCIECDACVDICPTDCITFTANGDEADLRTRLRAPARHADQALYVSDDAQDRPRHGQGRRRLPALRPVRRALPDRRLGHAEVHDLANPRRQRLPQAAPKKVPVLT